MIKNVVFDFGQVMVRFDPAYMVSLRVTEPDERALLVSVIFDRLYWNALDAGTTTNDEVLKAIWGYLSDKLIMPVSELSKENIAAELAAHHVSETLIGECTALLGECEFARYAPSLSATSEENIYNRTAELMNKLESAIKSNKL